MTRTPARFAQCQAGSVVETVNYIVALMFGHNGRVIVFRIGHDRTRGLSINTYRMRLVEQIGSGIRLIHAAAGNTALRNRLLMCPATG